MTQISFLRSYQQRENINSEATPISNAIQSRHATTPETESDAATPELQLSRQDLLSEFKGNERKQHRSKLPSTTPRM